MDIRLVRALRQLRLLVVPPFVLVSCLLGSSSNAFGDTIAEQLVARVDGRPVFLSEIRARARPMLARQRNMNPLDLPLSTQKVYAEVLERRIEEEVVAGLASSFGVVVSDAEVEAAILRQAAQNDMDRDALLAAALMQGMTADEYRVDLRRQLLRWMVLFALGARDKTFVAENDDKPTDGPGQIAWIERVARGPFLREKRWVCVERLVRW